MTADLAREARTIAQALAGKLMPTVNGQHLSDLLTRLAAALDGAPAAKPATRFGQFAAEPLPQIPADYAAPLDGCNTRQLIAERDGAPAAPDGPEHRYRHLKTGGTYKVLAHGKLEWSLAPVVIYEAETDGTIWVRPESEFFDGRFERIAALPAPTPAPINPVRDAERMTSEPKAKADSEAEQGAQLSRRGPAPTPAPEPGVMPHAVWHGALKCWTCPACKCQSCVAVHGSPDLVRCVNCKRELSIAAPSQPAQDAGLVERGKDVLPLVYQIVHEAWHSLDDSEEWSPTEFLITAEHYKELSDLFDKLSDLLDGTDDTTLGWEKPLSDLLAALKAAPIPVEVVDLAKELLALAEKATPGPWVADEFCMERDRCVRVGTTDGTETYYHRSASICEAWTNHDEGELPKGEPRIGIIDAERNAAFMARCREAVPILCRALTAAEKGAGR